MKILRTGRLGSNFTGSYKKECTSHYSFIFKLKQISPRISNCFNPLYYVTSITSCQLKSTNELSRNDPFST